jgi:hypothetical protein
MMNVEFVTLWLKDNKRTVVEVVWVSRHEIGVLVDGVEKKIFKKKDILQVSLMEKRGVTLVYDRETSKETQRSSPGWTNWKMGEPTMATLINLMEIGNLVQFAEWNDEYSVGRIWRVDRRGWVVFNGGQKMVHKSIISRHSSKKQESLV